MAWYEQNYHPEGESPIHQAILDAPITFPTPFTEEAYGFTPENVSQGQESHSKNEQDAVLKKGQDILQRGVLTVLFSLPIALHTETPPTGMGRKLTPETRRAIEFCIDEVTPRSSPDYQVQEMGLVDDVRDCMRDLV